MHAFYFCIRGAGARLVSRCLFILLLGGSSGWLTADQLVAPARGSIQVSFPGLRVTGLTEYPEQGITRYSLQDTIREEWSSARGKLSLEALQNIAGRITGIYRQAGFVFTRAYVPQQRSTDGVVEIRLLEGYLEAVDVYDNQSFDADTIRAAFAPLLGKVVVSADVEEAMALTNDLPGLTVFGFYSVGEQLGGTRINVRVRDEKSGSAAMRVDNYGSDLTGNGRLLFEWEKYNLLGAGDSLRIGALQTFDPENATYGLVDYRSVLKDSRNTLGLLVSANDYTLGRGRTGLGQLEISGETSSASLSFSNKVKRSAADTQVLSVSVNWDESRSKSDAFPEFYDLTTETWDVSLAYHFDLQNRKQRRWRTVSFEIKPGQYLEGNPINQDEAFWLVRGSNAVGRLFTPFTKGKPHKWINRLIGQYSEDVLPPDEQFALGGASSLRGFESGQFSADSGVLFSSEWFFPHFTFPSDIKVTPSVFFEYGYGVQRVNQSGLDDDWASLSDAGGAIHMSIGADISMVFSVAKPVESRISYSDDEDEDVQVLGELTWRFY